MKKSDMTEAELQELLASDAALLAEFRANPRPFLACAGLVCPEEVNIHLVENDAQNVTLIIGNPDLYSREQFASMPEPMVAVLTRAFGDPGFRSFLLSAPVDAIFLETGYRIPDGTAVTVRQTTENDLYFPIFVRGETRSKSGSDVHEEQNKESDELSDLELEEITGGLAGASSHISSLKMLSAMAPSPQSNAPPAQADTLTDRQRAVLNAALNKPRI
jgi:hypothetical protein